MGKLSMCRICLVENVRMYVIVNKNLHDLYEKLTDVPFITEDSRPILACSFCCAKLKQCFRLMKKCLEAEELFTQMMNEDCELNPSTNHDPLEFCSGFIKRAVEHISIDDGCQTESIAVKEELPDVCETQDIIEPKVEYSSDGTTVTKTAELDTRRLKQEDTITAELEKNEQSNLKLVETTQNRTSRSDKRPDQRSLYQVEDFRQDTRKGICEKKCKFDDQQTLGNNKHLTEHIGIDAGERRFKCDICQRSYTSKNNLKTHIRTHTGEKPYKCDICQRSFTRNDDLRNHVRTHTGETPFKCNVCPRSFIRKCQLTIHIRKHTGEKPFKCNVCQRGFTRKDDLRRHSLIHTGRQSYKCDICQRSFSNTSNLKTHIRIHTGEKPFKCNVCQLSFTRNDDLGNHVRTHTGETPFKCNVCLRSFIRKSHLTTHLKTHG